MLRTLCGALAALALGVAPAAALPDRSPVFEAQHFEFSFPAFNPCTGSPNTITIVEDFYVHGEPGRLNGIIETTTTTSDGWSSGPRVIGIWLERSSARTAVSATIQNDLLTNGDAGAIRVHVNRHGVVVDGAPVVVRLGRPRVSCVPRP
jgi:hypothetical protein